MGTLQVKKYEMMSGDRKLQEGISLVEGMRMRGESG